MDEEKREYLITLIQRCRKLYHATEDTDEPAVLDPGDALEGVMEYIDEMEAEIAK